MDSIISHAEVRIRLSNFGPLYYENRHGTPAVFLENSIAEGRSVSIRVTSGEHNLILCIIIITTAINVMQSRQNVGQGVHVVGPLGNPDTPTHIAKSSPLV